MNPIQYKNELQFCAQFILMKYICPHYFHELLYRIFLLYGGLHHTWLTLSLVLHLCVIGMAAFSSLWHFWRDFHLIPGWLLTIYRYIDIYAEKETLICLWPSIYVYLLIFLLLAECHCRDSIQLRYIQSLFSHVVHWIWAKTTQRNH